IFRIVIPRVSRPKPNQQQTSQQAPQRESPHSNNQQNNNQELIETLKSLANKMDKYQGDLASIINSSMEEMKRLIKDLNTSIEDMALSLKATQSDSSSPFNVISSETQKNVDNPSKNLKAVAEIVGTTNIDLSSFIRGCVLLEVLDYDEIKLNSLYELGYISADDMYVILKIQAYIRSNNGKMRARDLAYVAMNVAESYSSASAEMKKYLLLLEGEKR
ncbi:hypothetical protein DJ523_08210, partial [Sulfolobus sp. E5]